MTLGDLGKKLAGKGLKLLGGAIPGGGIVMDMVSSALDTDPTPEAVAKAIDENPDAALKLTEIQTRHKEVLEGIALERARLEVEQERDRLADFAARDSCRGRCGLLPCPQPARPFWQAGDAIGRASIADAVPEQLVRSTLRPRAA